MKTVSFATGDKIRLKGRPFWGVITRITRGGWLDVEYTSFRKGPRYVHPQECEINKKALEDDSTSA